jgi:hypothetical protein
VPATRFDGANDNIVLGIGTSFPLATGAHTIIAVVRRNVAGAWQTLLSAENNASTSVELAFEIDNTANLLDASDSHGANSIGTATTSPGTNVSSWWLFALTKATGATGAIRFHAANLTTGATPVHEPASAATYAATAPQRIVIGEWNGTDDLNAWFGVAAWFNVALTDTQINSLATGKKTSDIWNSAAGRPIGLWELNAAGPPTDLTGNSRNETSRNGTTIDAAETPPWTFDGLGVTFPPSVNTGIGLGRIGGGTIGIRAANVDTTPPTTNVTSASTFKMSSVSGKDSYAYSFAANEAIQAWKIKLVGNAADIHTAGTVIESGGSVASGTPIVGSITYAELLSAGANTDGAKIIKFFAQDLAGNWST